MRRLQLVLLASLAMACKSNALPTAGGDAVPAASITTPKSLALANAPKPPLDLMWESLRQEGSTYKANVRGGGTAELSVDADLQKFSERALAAAKLRTGAAVAIDVNTGRVLAFASYPTGATHQAALATAPAASVFKMITGTALLETGKVTPKTEECFGGGGSQRLTDRDLAVDPARDHTCVSLAHAMGHSTNAVFARLAMRLVPKESLKKVAERLRFTRDFGLDVPLQPSKYAPPDDDGGYARTAAGFWNTTLSAPHAAWLSAVVAGRGSTPTPWLIARAEREGASPYVHEAAAAEAVISPETASSLNEMLSTTVTDGTARKAFHDGAGRSFVGDVAVAGKTGTLTDHANKVYYTWFTSFAPAAPMAGLDPIAVAVLAANGPDWKIKANVIAREILRHSFAARKVPGVLANAAPAYEKPEKAKRSAGPAGPKKHTPAPR